VKKLRMFSAPAKSSAISLINRSKEHSTVSHLTTLSENKQKTTKTE
jgi:hypothetical protein